MISRSREHLRQADEGYWQHFRFATTFGSLAIAAGLAALIHAVVPALCRSTASRTIRHLGQLIEDRSQIDAVDGEAIDASAFVLLLLMATVVIAPLWALAVPTGLRLAYTGLAFALPLTLLFTNPDLVSTGKSAA